MEAYINLFWSEDVHIKIAVADGHKIELSVLYQIFEPPFRSLRDYDKLTNIHNSLLLWQCLRHHTFDVLVLR